jgi:hypothetical protein
MNLPAVLSILGIACYGALIYAVVASPRSTDWKIRRLFLGSLVVMVIWQLSALVVSLARQERTALAGYKAMSASVSLFGVSYALFIRAFLGKKNSKGWVLGGAALCVGTVALVTPDRLGVFAGVIWNDRTNFYLPKFGPLLPLAFAPYVLILGYVVVLLLRGYRGAQHPLMRHRRGLAGECIPITPGLSG